MRDEGRWWDRCIKCCKTDHWMKKYKLPLPSSKKRKLKLSPVHVHSCVLLNKTCLFFFINYLIVSSTLVTKDKNKNKKTSISLTSIIQTFHVWDEAHQYHIASLKRCHIKHQGLNPQDWIARNGGVGRGVLLQSIKVTVQFLMCECVCVKERESLCVKYERYFCFT